MSEVHMSGLQRRRLPQVRQLIAVGSGKGGVGKSTTALNLAIAWQQQGLRVGVLDADIYGPNQPRMLGVQNRPALKRKGEGFSPFEVDGLQTMSMGYLVDANTPMVLRGPMISKWMEQMLFQTHWSNLDLLVVDLPPGTGDIQLSLSKKVAIDGVIIVTTPQELALLDARKAIEMFNKMQVPVLGIIENMSTYQCTFCHHEAAIFGTLGGDALAKAYHLPLLGQLPLALAIRQASDQGKSLLLSAPQDALAKCYAKIADKIAIQLKKNVATFPDIVVE